jgi:hypothetical protein
MKVLPGEYMKLPGQESQQSVSFGKPWLVTEGVRFGSYGQPPPEMMIGIQNGGEATSQVDVIFKLVDTQVASFSTTQFSLHKQLSDM